jgi:hypothetical protein
MFMFVIAPLASGSHYNCTDRISNDALCTAANVLNHSLVPDAGTCCSICNQYPSCIVWTWHNDTHDCYVAHTKTSHGTSATLVSGERPARPTPTPTPAPTPKPPPLPSWGFRANILYFLTDDQDVRLNSMQAMPKTQELLVDCPSCTNFTNAWVATPICCPSRASYLTGMYQHNTRTHSNGVAQGCSDPHWISEIEPTKTYAPYMKAAGYATAFYGKYLNAYNGNHVPPGWDEWLGL